MAYNPKFQINLVKTFNQAFSNLDSKAKDQLRATLADPTFKNLFGKMVIDEIVKRTEGGIDRFGAGFAAYSKSYINSDVFKIYQKDSHVNLHLSGEMLASLKIEGQGNSLTVELIGDENKAKAHGHVYGIRRKGGSRVKRDFLGLPDDVLSELMNEAMKIARNDAYQAAVEYFDNTTMADFFGQVGNQPEFDVNIFTPDVLAQIARGLGIE
jgi:hypothetical protein